MPASRPLLVLLVGASLSTTGCATILNGSTSTMRIEGLPPDAVVETADGLPVARKPPLTRRRPPTDTVVVSNNDPPRLLRVRTSDGGVTVVRAKRYVGGGWIVLGILAGVIPLLVDAGSGAWFEYEDTSLDRGKKIAGATAR